MTSPKAEVTNSGYRWGFSHSQICGRNYLCTKAVCLFVFFQLSLGKILWFSLSSFFNLIFLIGVILVYNIMIWYLYTLLLAHCQKSNFHWLPYIWLPLHILPTPLVTTFLLYPYLWDFFFKFVCYFLVLYYTYEWNYVWKNDFCLSCLFHLA